VGPCHFSGPKTGIAALLPLSSSRGPPSSSNRSDPLSSSASEHARLALILAAVDADGLRDLVAHLASPAIPPMAGGTMTSISTASARL
jgi:hypothetical protein